MVDGEDVCSPTLPLIYNVLVDIETSVCLQAFACVFSWRLDEAVVYVWQDIQHQTTPANSGVDLSFQVFAASGMWINVKH